MAAASRSGLRKFWFQIHKWIGILLVVLLIPLSLSGAALVWGNALDRVINPQRYAVSGPATLPPSAYVAAAAKVLKPGERIASLRYPEGSGPVVVSAARAEPGGAAKAAPRRGGPPVRTNVWIDPANGRVLDVAASNTGVIRWLHVLHGSFLIPGVGRQIVGWLGVAMFLSCVSGLWLWWPSVGRWTRGLRWRRGRDLETNLHHQAGFWIALPLAMLCFTGVWISFPAFFAALTGAPPRAAGGPRGAAPAQATRLDPDAALAAVAARDGGAPASITWPTGKEGRWRVSLKAKPGTGGGGDYDVDDAGGEVAKAPDPRGNGGIARTMRRWHDGTGMGAVWQTLIFLGGILPALLGVTGIIMWLRTRGWRAAVARRQRERSTTPVAAE